MQVDGAKLRRLREDAGLDTPSLANAAQVARSLISMLETGARVTCSPPTAARLAQALGCAIVDLRPDNFG